MLSVLRFHLCHEIRQRPAGQFLESLGCHRQIFDAVDAEVTKSLSQFAPGGQRPGLAPVVEAERLDGALGPGLRLVYVAKAGLFLLTDGLPEIAHTRADLL